MPNLIEGKISSANNLLDSFISGAIILLFYVALDFLGVQNDLLKNFVLLFISWVGFFVAPIFLFFRPFAKWFVRFMKDTPLLFPAFFIAPLIQQMLFSNLVVSDRGFLLSSLDPVLFSVTYICITMFAANAHKIMAILLVMPQFEILARFFGSVKMPYKKSEDNENSLKHFTYMVLCIQVFPAMLILIVPIYIFQEVIAIPAILNFFGNILFLSGALMSIGVIKIFALSYENEIKVRYKVN